MISAIFDFFKTIFTFIGTLIDGIVWAITSIPSFAEAFTGIFAYSPPFLTVFLTVSLTVTVTYAVFKLL